MLGETLQPVLPRLAGLQRDGVVSTEKVQIVTQAMQKLSRAGLNPDAVDTAEQLLSDYAPVLGPTDLRRYALCVVDAADPDGPEPVDDQPQQDRRYLELKQRRDGMWHLQGKLTNTAGAQLNAILDPLTKPRSTTLEDHNLGASAGNDHPTPHDAPSARAEPLVELCSELRDVRQRSAINGSDRNRTAEAAGPKGAA
jgi:hypothetical protein